MAPGAACDAQVVQATGDLHDGIRQALGGVAELVFSNATYGGQLSIKLSSS